MSGDVTPGRVIFAGARPDLDTIRQDAGYETVLKYIEGCTKPEQLLWICLKIKEKLRTMGFSDPMYAKDNETIRIVEFGSAGVHWGYRMKETQSFWIMDNNDLWPSDPLMFRELTAEEKEQEEKGLIGKGLKEFVPSLGANEGGK